MPQRERTSEPRASDGRLLHEGLDGRIRRVGRQSFFFLLGLLSALGALSVLGALSIMAIVFAPVVALIAGGDFAGFDPGEVSWRSIAGFAYLLLGGTGAGEAA